jgi:hypothetical protein
VVEKELEITENVVSPYGGEVLEIKVSPGASVQRRVRLHFILFVAAGGSSRATEMSHADNTLTVFPKTFSGVLERRGATR